MEIRDYLYKNNMILIYHRNMFFIYGGDVTLPAIVSDVSDILPVVCGYMPHDLYFQFGADDDFYKNYKEYKKKKRKTIEKSFYDFIDRIRDGLI